MSDSGISAVGRRRLEYELQKILTVGWGINYISHHYPLCAELESHGDSNPSALSSKRPRIVTHPDVERALYLWVLHMEEEKEMVNGPMLHEK